MRFYSMCFTALLLGVVFMTGCGRMIDPAPTPDATLPSVTLTAPLNGAANVPIGNKLSATFSEAMDSTTITGSTFTLKAGTTVVAGSISYSGVTAVFDPTSDLAANTIYTATITTGVKDLSGNALAVNKVWTFTTGVAADITAPTVSSIIPANLDTGVAINRNILATFSEAMDPLTITDSTFTLKNGTTSIACAVTYAGLVATLNPTSNLSANTTYTVTITTGAKDLAGNALAVDKTSTFTTGSGSDTTAPTVISVIPADLGTNVALNQNVLATFSEAMDPLTITNLTFTLTDGTNLVTADVTYVGTVATLNPTGNLAPNTTYYATISTGTTDLAGNALAVNKLWSFTTGAGLDTTAPTVRSTSPVDLAINVAVGGDITANFSEGMDPLTLTVTTFTLKQGTTLITGDVTCVGTQAAFNPTSNLAAGTTYVATITTGAKDLAGNALGADKVWSFTTAAADTTAPTVSSTTPIDLATGEAVNANVTATFSEAMSRETISTSTFTLKNKATSASITGEVTYSANVATFNPTSNLAAGTSYEATITTGATDISGNALATNEVWVFTTAVDTTEAAGPAAVVLGTAGNFAILSKSGIALSVGGTARVNGNMGVSPAAASYITNASLIMDSSGTFSTSTQVPGYKVYASDYSAPTPSMMTTAISNMETAYSDAAGRSNPTATELGAGDIGGMTLVPGMYKWSTSLLIPTDVYLTGGANDVWIFEVAQDLTLSNGITVHMTGGAQAKNVYWQVAGHVTLGTTSVMNGNMICLTDMTMLTGSTLNGRLLAQTAVTLQENTIVNLP